MSNLCPSPSSYVGVLRQQAPRARPTARTACLFVCLFVELYRSNFVVPARFRDLRALIENRAHVGVMVRYNLMEVERLDQ